jgi:putative hydrolase of the HAD superfamily
LLDFGGTLVEEVAYDPRAGLEALLAHAAVRRADVHFGDILARAQRVTEEIAGRRDRFQIETPWVSLNRLIHDFFGTRFAAPPEALELVFWDASVTTRPMPGAREALDTFHRTGIPTGVVSNSSFGRHVIRHELAKHGLADHLAFVVVSAEYVVRKPNPLLFETAAALLGVPSTEVWFVGDSFDTDMVGARAAGMTSVWFAAAATEHRDGADLVVPSWPALAKRVELAAAESRTSGIAADNVSRHPGGRA